ILGGDGECGGAALGIGAIEGPLHSAAGIVRYPAREVFRRPGAPGSDLPFLVGHFESSILGRGVEDRRPVLAFEFEMAVLGVLGIDGHHLAGPLVLEGDGAVGVVGADQIELRVHLHRQLRCGKGGILLELRHLLLGEPAPGDHQTAEDQTGDDDQAAAANEDPAERTDPGLDRLLRCARRRRDGLRRTIHGVSFRGLIGRGLRERKIPPAKQKGVERLLASAYPSLGSMSRSSGKWLRKKPRSRLRSASAWIWAWAPMRKSATRRSRSRLRRM